MEIDSSPPSTKIRNRCPRNSIVLPLSIIRKILSKLPVKSLLRFRCASKSWFSIISSHGFIKAHLKNSIKNPSFPKHRVLLHNLHHSPQQSSLQLLFSDASIEKPSPLFITTNDQSKALKIVGCCDGLVCILEEPKQFFICNPSTRISRKLPEIRGGHYVENYGFGRVESSDEYKVFAVVSSFNNNLVVVYSSRTKSWSEVTELESPFGCDEGVFLDGKLHWEWKNRCVAIFDLKSESFKRTIMSPDDRRGCLNKSLGVVGGCLCMLFYHHTGIRVWALNKTIWEEVWSPRHVLELVERPCSNPYTVGGNREILLFHGPTFLIYTSRDCRFRCPKIFCNYEFHQLYVESLVSPADFVKDRS